nr:MAG TPA: hypothetical protein [Caudoviricetes sp.]
MYPLLFIFYTFFITNIYFKKFPSMSKNKPCAIYRNFNLVLKLFCIVFLFIFVLFNI